MNRTKIYCIAARITAVCAVILSIVDIILLFHGDTTRTSFTGGSAISSAVIVLSIVAIMLGQKNKAARKEQSA